MAKFQKSVDVWTLTQEQRARLQVGQHITAGGAGGATGRWCGQTKLGTDVAMWRAGVKREDKSRKMRVLIDYAKGK